MKRWATWLGVAGLLVSQATGATAAPTQWSSAVGGNNHWYERISNPPLLWGAALNAAAASTFDPDGAGPLPALQGYLATITSAAEQRFLTSTFGADPEYWIAGSDATTEGTWKWVAGPENGTTFWMGGPSPGGTVVGYANWMPGEPANVVGNEDFAIANWEVLDGVFTDRWAAKCATECVHPYMIEYGGAVSAAAVPEPATLSLLLTGAAVAIAWRRRFSNR